MTAETAPPASQNAFSADFASVCPHCVKKFTVSRPHQLYCSNVCRSAAHRKARGERATNPVPTEDRTLAGALERAISLLDAELGRRRMLIRGNPQQLFEDIKTLRAHLDELKEYSQR